MNISNLRGRLTTDPEVNYTKDGASVVSFTLAVPDRLGQRDKDGNFPADFIRCVMFGKEAEVMEAYGVKGTEIILTGKIKTGSYTKDDVKHFTTEVQSMYFEFVSGTKSKENNSKKQEKTGK